jgi:hypothetical protein
LNLLLLLLQSNMSLPVHETCDLLQLVMNCSSHATAAAAAVIRLPAQLEPECACGLLLTAIVRQHQEAVMDMLQLDAVNKQADCMTLEAVLRLLVLSYEETDFEHQCLVWGCVAFLLPAGRMIGTELVFELLWEAVQRDVIAAVSGLCMLSAAQQLRAGNVMQLLQALFKQGRSSHNICMTETIVRLPAARQLSGNVIALLSRSAMQPHVNDSSSVVQRLRKLPAARHLPSSTAEDLLHEAGNLGASSCSQSLQQLLEELERAARALQQVGRVNVLQLLQALLSTGRRNSH